MPPLFIDVSVPSEHVYSRKFYGGFLMKNVAALLLGSCLLLGTVSIPAAQEKSDGTTPPPKVLSIFREFLKPGKAGSPHEKAESQFVQAFARAKWTTHYLTLASVTGKPRALFLTGYDSFEAWEKDLKAVEKNSTLASSLDRSAIADGDLLSDTDASALVYSEEYSFHAPVDIPHMRYFEISVFQVRPGHRKEWDEAVKLVMQAYEKIPDTHWATYEVMYGQLPRPTYVIFTPLKSAADIDRAFGQSKQFMAALGEEGMKKLSELEIAAVDSSQTNLFAFSPKMSYVPDEWVKADPEFWKPKPMAAGSKSVAKPAANQ
jgi:hypothetical protein